jgi:hypothetical protein
MPQQPIHHYIAQAAGRSEGETRALILRMISSSWPGGTEDRSEPIAAQWLRRWRPDIIVGRLPACSCRRGHCAVCN